MNQTTLPARFRDAEAAVHEMATAMAGGLTDFGPDHYRAGLAVLLESLDADARILPERRAFVFGELALTLVARLHTEAGWRANPAARDIAIKAPLVVAGLPRSCTTVLQRLLAVDPQFQYVDSWLVHAPQTRPVGGDVRESAAFQRAASRFADWYETVPQWARAHDMAADDPEECIELLRQDFVSNRFGCIFNVPGYDRWWLQQSEVKSYRRWADVLRLIGAAEPERCWLLKNPGHIHGMDALLDLFPDARIVYTHRDPLPAMASVSSVIHMAHQTSEGPDSDALCIGPRENLVWSTGTNHMMASRARRPDNFHDVYHSAFVADPMAVVRGIYARFDLELRAPVETAMRAWVAANPQGKHGEHRYELAQFGLTEEAVRAAYRDYIATYGPF